MEEKLFVQDKQVVVPGEVLAQGLSFLPGNGTYRSNESIIANRLGLLTMEGKVMKTIPLAGRYLPKRNDVIVGRVVDILMSGWRLDISSPYSAVLPLKDATFSYIEKGDDLTRYFELDDYIVCKITNVTSQNLIDVSCKGPGLQKLRGGRVVEVGSQKVPRIIGKRGSMVGMIKMATGCKITVGQNGVVWLNGEPDMEHIAVSALHLIEEKSHTSGLTERVKKFLEEATGKTINLDELPEESDGYASEERESRFSDNGDGPRYDSRERDDRRGSYGGSRGGDRRGGGGFRKFDDRPRGGGGNFRDRPRFNRSDDSSEGGETQQSQPNESGSEEQ
jgi:exosome complex component RRP4